MTDEVAVRNFFSTNRITGITELIYCAGLTSKSTPIENLDCDEFERVLQVNTVGFARVIKYSPNILFKTPRRLSRLDLWLRESPVFILALNTLLLQWPSLEY